MGDDTARGAIDPDRFDVLRRACDAQNGPHVLRELVAGYLDVGAARLEGLRGALAAGDAAEVERLAHALKGSSASFAAVVVAGLAEQLEDAARRGDLATAPAVLVRLDAEFGRAADALHRATRS